MILNKLVFVIRPSGSGKLEFVEPFTRDFKLTANSINRDIFYVVAPFAADTYVKATFKSKEQAEKGENVSLRFSELEPKDIINDNLGGFNLIEDWFVWEGKVPSKALGYVSAHRGNEIGLSISFEEKTVPRVPVGVELKGEIVKLDDLDGEGAYVIKVPALEYDTEEYAFYKDLLILDNEEEITIKKSIIRRLGTITEHYYVDPNVYDEGWEQIPDEDYEFIPDLIMATGDNKSDIKLIYLSLESLDDKVLVLEQHAIDTDIELNRLYLDIITKFNSKVDKTTRINDIEIQDGATIHSKDVPFSDSNVKLELERLENDKADKVELEPINNELLRLEQDKAVKTEVVSDIQAHNDNAEAHPHILNLISQIPKFDIKIVTELPITNISTTTIYVLDNEEWIYVDNNWEKLGSFDVNIEDYYTKVEIDGKLVLINNELEQLEERVETNETDIQTNTNDIIDLQTNKQDKLVAGNNISIVGNTISASGGGGNSNNPDGVTIVLNEDDKLEVNLKHIMNGGYL